MAQWETRRVGRSALSVTSFGHGTATMSGRGIQAGWNSPNGTRWHLS